MSRTQEKRELGALNSRLAAYIERVRTLEVDNNRLEQQMTTIEETNTKEVISIRNMYDKELSQVHIYLINFPTQPYGKFMKLLLSFVMFMIQHGIIYFI